MEVESRWNPVAEVEVSGGESLAVEQRGRIAVWEGKFLMRNLQKHGVVDGWTPEPAGLVARGSFRARDSTIRRTNGHGSIVIKQGLVFFVKRFSELCLVC